MVFVAVNFSHRAMGHDEETYPNPSHFDPGRHFTAGGELKDEPTYGHFGFGFGRFAMPFRFGKMRLMSPTGEFVQVASLQTAPYGHPLCRFYRPSRSQTQRTRTERTLKSSRNSRVVLRCWSFFAYMYTG